METERVDSSHSKSAGLELPALPPRPQKLGPSFFPPDRVRGHPEVRDGLAGFLVAAGLLTAGVAWFGLKEPQTLDFWIAHPGRVAQRSLRTPAYAKLEGLSRVNDRDSGRRQSSSMALVGQGALPWGNQVGQDSAISLPVGRVRLGWSDFEPASIRHRLSARTARSARSHKWLGRHRGVAAPR